MDHFYNIIAEEIGAIAKSCSTLGVPTTKEAVQFQLENMQNVQQIERELYLTEKLSCFKEMKYHRQMKREIVEPSCSPEEREERNKKNVSSRKSRFNKSKREFIQKHENTRWACKIVTCSEKIELERDAIAYCEKYLRDAGYKSMEKLKEPYQGMLEDTPASEVQLSSAMENHFKATISQLAQCFLKSWEENGTRSRPDLNGEEESEIHYQELANKIIKSDYED